MDLLGIRLLLQLGRTVPLPAPYAVMSALREIEVTNKDRERDGFKLKLTLGKETPLDYSLLTSGLLDPPNRLVISVIFGALPQVLIDGIITHQQFQPSNQPGESQLHLMGESVAVMLELEEKTEVYPNQPDSVIVTRLLASYAQYGLVPKVTTTTDIPIETDRVPSQQGSDLACIQSLAEKNGFVFYIEPGPVPGTNIAYWGPENRLDVPQSALTMNMGALTNVDAPINFTYNALGPASPEITIVEPNTRLPISIPVPSGLNLPLARRPATVLRRIIDRNSAKLNPYQAGLRGTATSSESADPIQASGELNAVRYGRSLKSRRLVGVRGVGDTYNGDYYVKEVTHTIQAGSYRQQFKLKREGFGAVKSVVTL
ncbi:MAG: hypothetical protein DWQ04_13395 [Chloroflexi bacterium]|nr:MAG: hypothetical protein DWQ04_13395 [Chloroflexota bacterium]